MRTTRPLGYNTAYVAQNVFAVSLLLLIGFLVSRRYPALVAAAIGVSRAYQAGFQWGNFAIITNGLLILSFLLLLRRKDKWAGVVLGITIAFRWYPALFVLPLIMFRRRAAIWSGITAIGLTALSVLTMGWHLFSRGITWQLHQSRPDAFIQSMNYSIPSFVFRATRNAHAFDLAFVLLLAIFVLITLKKCHTLTSAYAFTSFAVLAVSPITWGYYFGVVAIPLIAYGAKVIPIRHPAMIVFASALAVLWWPADLTKYGVPFGFATFVYYKDLIATLLIGVSMYVLLQYGRARLASS